MSERVSFFLHNNDIRNQVGRSAAELIDKQFSFVDYVYFLLEQSGHQYGKVSVIVPNYNYASYLDDRFRSIIHQKYPVYEIIFLDDCSSDDSVEKMKYYSDTSPIPVRLLVNTKNSGSVFRQWVKGISAARGDFIWIAEADDLSDERFLSEVMKGFSDPEVVLSYAQSSQIDSEGKEIGPNYRKYTSEIDEDKWKKNYRRKGTSEICDSLVIKNSIPNVSATVFKKIDMTGILDELIKFKNAGDWYFYVWLLQRGNIYFVSESLNIHRRHRKSVTLKENPQSHFDEIRAVQDYIISHFDVDETNVKKALRYREYVKGYFFGQQEN
jgi:glycosyltransferase involved in cell wall biosynthesis